MTPEEVAARFRLALNDFLKGDPAPSKEFWSHRDDVTLANPLGPTARGWAKVSARMDAASAIMRDGEITGVDLIAKYESPELVCLVEVERQQAKVGGDGDIRPFELRVSTVYRLEDGVWRIAHRHADPITAALSPESMLDNRA